MNALQAIQQRMLQAVLAEQASALRDIRGDDTADAEARLAVYRHGYRIRLRDALKHEFPGLRCLAGARFETLLDHYITAHPSGHYNIRWYGSGLAAFLEYAMPWRDKPQLAEMAQLDWAVSTAFDAADETSRSVADLMAVPPEAWADLRFVLVDNLRIVTAAHNAEAFRRAADLGKPRPRLRKHGHPRRILVWRMGLAVHYRCLDDDEWLVLNAAMHNRPFAELCGKLAECHDPSAAMPRMVTLLRHWLETGLVRDWS